MAALVTSLITGIQGSAPDSAALDALVVARAVPGAERSGAAMVVGEIPTQHSMGLSVLSSVELFVGNSRVRQCPSARKGLRFYRAAFRGWREKMGAGRSQVPGHTSRPASCPRILYLARIWRQKARAARRAFERWQETRTLRDYSWWRKAVQEAQKPYPGTEAWLMSCSRSEGGWGRWVPNGDGSGAGGWMQYLSGTFWRHWAAAYRDLRTRRYFVPRSAHSWYSALGQALAGAWGLTHGSRGEWYGSGC